MSALYFAMVAVLVVTALGAAVAGFVPTTSLSNLLATIVLSIPALALVGLVWGIGPGLVFAFHALLYNIVAHFFGGVIVRLDRRGQREVVPDQPSAPKRKRDAVPMPTVPTGANPRDEIALINSQIKERQRRIAEINADMFKKP